MENTFIIITFGLIGLLVGSLLTHLAHRIPLILIAHQQKKTKILCNQCDDIISKQNQNISLLFSRPICPCCFHPLTLRSLIPVYSWLKQQGRCRDCQQAISSAYPFTELITAFLFMVIISAQQNFIWLLILLLITSLLITAMWIDTTHQLLPNVLTFPLICFGFLISLFDYAPLTLLESLAGAFLGYLLLWLPAVIFTALKGFEGLGRGDMKLIAGLGAWVGPAILPTVVFVASLGALGFILFTYGYKHCKNKRIAFGPFLAIAGWLALLKDPFMIDLSILLRALL